jgi:hypothetical protein
VGFLEERGWFGLIAGDTSAVLLGSRSSRQPFFSAAVLFGSRSFRQPFFSAADLFGSRSLLGAGAGVADVSKFWPVHQ